MARLEELAEDYREAAVRLRLGLEEAKARLAGLTGPERRELEERIRMMRQMLQEMRDLRQVTGGYYTRSRDGRYTVSTLKAPKRAERDA